MDISSLLGTLGETLANLGIDFDAIAAALQPVLEQIMAVVGPILGL
ncbi:MAG: hypothetical protein ACI4K6_00595 [Candidatus Fimenecus sp.]